MRKSPWHSIKQNVCHDNTSCTEGNNIERENLRQRGGQESASWTITPQRTSQHGAARTSEPNV